MFNKKNNLLGKGVSPLLVQENNLIEEKNGFGMSSSVLINDRQDDILVGKGNNIVMNNRIVRRKPIKLII